MLSQTKEGVPFLVWDDTLTTVEVHTKASNVASRAELAKYLIIIDINKKILSYLSYLQDKDDSSIVKHHKWQLSFTEIVKIVFTQI